MRISDWSSDVCSSDLHAYPGKRIRWCLCRAQDIERLLDALNQSRAGDGYESGDVAHLREMAEEAPVVELVNNLKIGRASCRERVYQYVSISVVAVSLKHNIKKHTDTCHFT